MNVPKITPEEFIKAKYTLSNKTFHTIEINSFTGGELAELIEEYEQVKKHIEQPIQDYDKTRPIIIENWIAYNNRYLEWDKREYNDSMSKAMSMPNVPNYFRANND